MAKSRIFIGLALSVLVAAIAGGTVTAVQLGSSEQAEESPASTTAEKTSESPRLLRSTDAEPFVLGVPFLPSIIAAAQARAATEDDEELVPNPAVEIEGRWVDPDDYHQVIPRDHILPVYKPSFSLGSSVSLEPDALVIGVDINGETKAYPVGPLVYREMVNDVVGGVPLLVTW